MSESKPPKKKHRSPAYPCIGLATAIERAKTLLEHAGKHETPLNAAAEYWGYKPTSSGFLQVISALKQYGLLQDHGSKEGRTIKLSPSALKILWGEEGSGEVLGVIQEAALLPKLHAELWDKYEQSLPPNDATLRSHLLQEKGFNPGAVDGFIKDLRETISFASLNDPDTIEDRTSGAVDAKGNHMQATTTERDTRGPSPPSDPPAAQKGMRDFPLYTTEKKGALYVPESMSRKDFDLLKLQIQNSLAIIEATAVPADSE